MGAGLLKPTKKGGFFLVFLFIILIFTWLTYWKSTSLIREEMVKHPRKKPSHPGIASDYMGRARVHLPTVFVLAGIGVAVVVGLSRKMTKKVRKNKLEADNGGYNLKQMTSTPRLNGWKLRLLAWLNGSFMSNLGIAKTAFRRTHFDFFRTVHFLEEPSFTPNPKTFTDPRATPEEPHRIDLETFIEGPTRQNADFKFFSISDYYSAYRKGITTPAEVTEWVILKVKESGMATPGGLCAVTQMDETSARKMAKKSADRISRGKPLSFLDGVPVLIKEEINCVPYRTRCGTTFMGEEPTKQDSTIAKKLKDAGAVVIGVTNMHELGMSVFGYNIHRCHGMPRNPYNPNHYTGGSSSGSAAAVAAGLVPLAIGTDGGGSIRVPSTLCGNVGLKPTFGRVSFGGNEVSCHSVVHAGPICSSVNDAALVYALLAGPDPKDPLSMNQPKISLAEYSRHDLKGVRIGVDWDFLRDSNPDVEQACVYAIEELKTNHGAEIVNINIPELQELRIAHTMIIYTEMRESFDECYHENISKLNPENQVIFRTTAEVTGRDYIGANKQRTRSIHFLEQLFKEVDVIITPACGQTAPKIEPGDESCGCSDLRASLQIAKYMLFGNLTGVPGLVVPIAYSDGLPIGLQITGRWWQEDMVLAVGKFAEKILQQKEKPQIFYRNDSLLPTEQIV